MKIFITLAFLVVLIPQSSSAKFNQSDSIYVDSLRRNCHGAADTSRVKYQNLIASIYLKHNYDSSLAICEKNIRFIKDRYNNVSGGVREKFDLALFNAYWLTGKAFKRKNDLLRALESHQLAYDQAIVTSDPKCLRRINNSLGNIYLDKGEFAKSLMYYEDAVGYARQEKDTSFLPSILMNIGLIHVELRNDSLASHFLNRALRINIKTKKRSSESICLQNLGILESYNGRSEAAKEYISRAIAINEELNLYYHLTVNYLELGRISFELDQDTMASWKHYLKAKEYSERLNDKHIIGYVDNIIEVFELIHGNEAYLDKVQNRFFNGNYKNNQMTSGGGLVAFYKLRKNYKKALEIFEIIEQRKDSFFDLETKSSAKAAAVKMEFDKLIQEKEHEIALGDVKTELYKSKARNNLYLMVAFGTLFMMLLAIVYFWTRAKNRKLQLANLKEENLRLKVEQKNKQLSELLKQEEQKKATLKSLEIQLQEAYESASCQEAITKVQEQVVSVIKDQTEWDTFQQKFEQHYGGFLNKLVAKHPKLTTNEKKLCTLILMNHNNHEISEILYIEYNSVRMAKSRLKKKLGIQDSLDSYLFSI